MAGSGRQKQAVAAAVFGHTVWPSVQIKYSIDKGEWKIAEWWLFSLSLVLCEIDA